MKTHTLKEIENITTARTRRRTTRTELRRFLGSSLVNDISIRCKMTLTFTWTSGGGPVCVHTVSTTVVRRVHIIHILLFITSYYFVLLCITLYCIILHYFKLFYIILHTTLYYIQHCITLFYTILHYMTCDNKHLVIRIICTTDSIYIEHGCISQRLHFANF